MLRNKCVLCFSYFLLKSKFYFHFYCLKLCIFCNSITRRRWWKNVWCNFQGINAKSNQNLISADRFPLSHYNRYHSGTSFNYSDTLGFIFTRCLLISCNSFTEVFFLRRYIIVCHDLSKTMYVGYTVLIAKRERKKKTREKSAEDSKANLGERIKYQLQEERIVVFKMIQPNMQSTNWR